MTTLGFTHRTYVCSQKTSNKSLKNNDSVTVRVIAEPATAGEGNLSDFGASVSRISTYLCTGMAARYITDACTMPVIHENLLDAKPYRDAMVPGHIYFVFHPQPYLEQNEKFADCTRENDNPGTREVAEGTALETGSYSGYDMIGFAPNEDLSKLLEIVTKA